MTHMLASSENRHFNRGTMTDFLLAIVIGLLSLIAWFAKSMLGDIKTTIDKIKNNVKVIGDHLTNTDSNFNHSELQTYSPLRLTDEGKKFIKDLGFDNAFEKHRDDFFSFVNDEEPKLKYDVERAAIKAVYALSDKDYMSFLKVFFYNNPDRSMKNVAPTLGVYVRDKYLEEHPEITE